MKAVQFTSLEFILFPFEIPFSCQRYVEFWQSIMLLQRCIVDAKECGQEASVVAVRTTADLKKHVT